MKIRILLLIILLTIATTGFVSAQSLAAQVEETKEKKVRERGIPALIFSAPNVLLDIESYDGGFGYKELFDDVANRWSVDIFYAHGSSLLSLYTIYAKEIHYTVPVFEKFYISPFIGWFVGGGTVWQRNRIDADNGTNDFSFPLTGGPLIGAELFIFPFLSVFAEYRLAIDLTANLVLAKSAGTTTPDFSMNIIVDTRMGNGSKLGVVLYLPEQPLKLLKPKKEEPEV